MIDINDNQIQIENIPFKCVKSRIKREYEYLSIKYPKIIIKYNNILNEVNLTVFETEKDDSFKYTFILTSSYPFSPPKIYCNNIEYSNFLKLSSDRMHKYLQNITKLECLCCTSYICTDNWSLTLKLINVIDEIHDKRKIKRNIIIKILCDQIINKYLINDIKLDKYLFDI
jgi:ubiquitin-protein ligase